ncbi:MAG TPA: MerR family transcriptional regulator [Fimbriimonas sp.]
MSPTYPIRAVAERTGLSAHTIRAWERRYGVLTPDRTGTNRRLYGEEDVERLILLRRAASQGHSIGSIARLSTPDLQRIVGARPEPEAPDAPRDFLAGCRSAMKAMDAAALEAELVSATTVLGVQGLLTSVVIPLIGELDRGWQEGSLSIAQEHLATAVLRTQLERTRLSLQAPPDAPRLIVTTPSGQIHELGALIVAVTASCEGWRVTYLGPNLPADEIALAAKQVKAQAVALSLVYPAENSPVSEELRRLRRELGPRTPILVGGRSAGRYGDVLREVGAKTEEDYPSVREALADFRRSTSLVAGGL